MICDRCHGSDTCEHMTPDDMLVTGDELQPIAAAFIAAARAEGDQAGYERGQVEIRRLRDALVSARWRLSKGAGLWNGPCHECDAVLKAALKIGGPDEFGPTEAMLAAVRREARREAIEECARYLRTLGYYDQAHALTNGEHSPLRCFSAVPPTQPALEQASAERELK